VTDQLTTALNAGRLDLFADIADLISVDIWSGANGSHFHPFAGATSLTAHPLSAVLANGLHHCCDYTHGSVETRLRPNNNLVSAWALAVFGRIEMARRSICGLRRVADTLDAETQTGTDTSTDADTLWLQNTRNGVALAEGALHDLSVVAAAAPDDPRTGTLLDVARTLTSHVEQERERFARVHLPRALTLANIEVTAAPQPYLRRITSIRRGRCDNVPAVAIDAADSVADGDDDSAIVLLPWILPDEQTAVQLQLFPLGNIRDDAYATVATLATDISDPHTLWDQQDVATFAQTLSTVRSLFPHMPGLSRP
jgi:hypothetical protein